MFLYNDESSTMYLFGLFHRLLKIATERHIRVHWMNWIETRSKRLIVSLLINPKGLNSNKTMPTTGLWKSSTSVFHYDIKKLRVKVELNLIQIKQYTFLPVLKVFWKLLTQHPFVLVNTFRRDKKCTSILYCPCGWYTHILRTFIKSLFVSEDKALNCYGCLTSMVS